jgi:hypothetical protein
MLVKMLSTRKGSPNGLDSETYVEGKQYDIQGELLDVFLKEGWAEPADPFPQGEGAGEAAAEGASDGEAAPEAAISDTGPADGLPESGAVEGDPTQPGGADESEGAKEPELMVAEADVLMDRYTRDELLDLAEEQEIEVPAGLKKKADVAEFLAGKLKVTVEAQ